MTKKKRKKRVCGQFFNISVLYMFFLFQLFVSLSYFVLLEQAACNGSKYVAPTVLVGAEGNFSFMQIYVLLSAEAK